MCMLFQEISLLLHFDTSLHLQIVGCILTNYFHLMQFFSINVSIMITNSPHLMSSLFINAMHNDFWVTNWIHFISVFHNDMHCDFNPFEVTLYGHLAVHVLDRLLGSNIINSKNTLATKRVNMIKKLIKLLILLYNWFEKILWNRTRFKLLSWQAFAARHGCFFWSVWENVLPQDFQKIMFLIIFDNLYHDDIYLFCDVIEQLLNFLLL